MYSERVSSAVAGGERLLNGCFCSDANSEAGGRLCRCLAGGSAARRSPGWDLQEAKWKFSPECCLEGVHCNEKNPKDLIYLVCDA